MLMVEGLGKLTDDSSITITDIVDVCDFDILIHYPFLHTHTDTDRHTQKETLGKP